MEKKIFQDLPERDARGIEDDLDGLGMARVPVQTSS